MRAPAFILLLLLASCATPGGVDGVHKHYGSKPKERNADPEALEVAGRWLDAGELRFYRGGADEYLQAAHDAWRWIGTVSDASEQDRERARRLYNHAVAAYVVAVGADARPGSTTLATYNIDSHFSAESEAPKGLGAPFVILPGGPIEEFGEGLVTGSHNEVAATTAILRFEQGRPQLTFHDPLRESRVEMHGRSFPLTSHVMAALEFRVAAAEKELKAWRLDAALRPAMDDAGFSLVEPPRSDKIPVLFVHGLQHSPTDFARMIAGLMSSPTLRTRYQFITYRWATGLPLPISVAIFRRQLGEFWSWFDALAPQARERGYWVLSHSMGGLLAKTLMVESGDHIIEAMFRVPRTEIDLESDLGIKVERALVYHPDPRIAGVIFMAVPHRGSGYAASAIGDIGTELITPGAVSTNLVREFVERYGDQLKPEVLALLRNKTTSLQNLRPNDWYLRALASCPFSPNIPFHSIIGDIFGTPEIPVGDGVVSYKSAHLGGAESEVVVRAPHNLQKSKVVLTPVKRILLEYLQEE